jgi:hypothetical protein
LGQNGTEIFFGMGLDSADYTKSRARRGAIFIFGARSHSELSTDVCFSALSGLKSDVTALPKWADFQTCTAIRRKWQSHHNADSIGIPTESFVVNIPFVSSTAVFALVAACAVTLTSTAAPGACHATLRGELVPDDNPKQRFRAAPQKLLFFSLDEIVEENGQTVEKNFQSSTLSNAKMTFPIPFVLNVNSPKDCPREVLLNVHGSDHVGFHYEFPMRGRKKISVEKPEFETVVVYPPTL